MAHQLDLTACDREPIHIPEAVQPHGALLVLDRFSLSIERAGGACEPFFGRSAAALLGHSLTSVMPQAARLLFSACDREPRYVGTVVGSDAGELDVVAHVSTDKLVAELERAPATRLSAADMARLVELHSGAFTAARSVAQLCNEAALRFRAITGFDRVMVYRFLADDTGSVVAEDKNAELAAFLNHRYPASDIPQQARALYVRNIIRVIPDVHYVPSSLSARSLDVPLDMSDCHLRSVSPIHIQYLKNMGVGASASVSIVREGKLWGLLAFHHRAPRSLSFDQRLVCRLLAGALARHVASLEDMETFRSRMRSRAAEDVLLGSLARARSVEEGLAAHTADLLGSIPAHGVAVRYQASVAATGSTPSTEQVAALGDWLLSLGPEAVFESSHLSQDYPAAAELTSVAGGLLALTLSADEPHQILWFRAEQIEEIDWAGNPHKAAEPGEGSATALTPRRSFELWRETVTGRSAPWSATDTEAAARLGRALGDLKRSQRAKRLNEALQDALVERDRLISQKDFLLREGDHRIQNSLQIVGGMLSMQLRETTDRAVRAQLEEAMSRVQAVALVHRRLHKAVEPLTVNVDTYVEELVTDLGKSLGQAWASQLRLDTAPVSGPTNLAVSLGLALTELVLNAVKYAYDGQPGPLEIELDSRNDRLRLSVRDRGRGFSNAPAATGLGTQLILRLVEHLGGTITREDASPGLRVAISVPMRTQPARTTP